jgi:UDP-2,3-diacylglucosamine hydrolase
VATLFIADLHLQTEEPAITAGFLRFLQGEARQADALYILGDLFEAWIGDDDPTRCISKSPRQSKRGRFRRPLLLHSRQPRFSRRPALRPRKRHDLLPEESARPLWSQVLIMHGDTLCTDDTGYLAFRAKVHTRGSSAVPGPAAVYPPPYRRQNARRQQSRQQQQIHGIMDVNPGGR